MRTAVQEAAVVVINSCWLTLLRVQILISTCLAIVCLPVLAAVLPDERVDLLQHQYEGGGIKVSGPSILVRKNIGTKVSLSANYYVDMVSSASIDVLASASRYSEERKQKSVGVDYMFDRTTYSLGYTTSDENDYQSKTYLKSTHAVGANELYK